MLSTLYHMTDLFEFNFATITSWKHGDHNICFCKDIDTVMETIDQTHLVDENPELRNYGCLKDVRAKLETLKMSENIWLEWNNSNWMTIQRMTPSIEEVETLVLYKRKQ